MSFRVGRFRWVVLATLLLSALTVGVHYGKRTPPSEVPAEPAANPEVLPPATQLQVQVGESRARAELLLNADADAWKAAPRTTIGLSHTPRIYQTEPAVNLPVPRCEVRALRAGSEFYLRLTWEDATKNAPQIHRAQTGAGGAPRQPYRDPAPGTAAFPDAAAVMVPTQWTGPAFPSLMMGDATHPTRLYYWNASRGASVLTSTGRTTPQASSEQFPHSARYADRQWTLTMQLPTIPDGAPVAFAVWDGQFGDRDGLKFFSVWHVLHRSTR